MDDRGLLSGQTIRVRQGRIAAMGPRDSIVYDTATFTEIDARNGFVIPGLVDAHVHLRESTAVALLPYLRAGVTTIRDMNGRPFLLEGRDRIEQGDLAGPTMHVASPPLGNFSSPRKGYPTPETVAEGREAVRRFHAEGYDWIKVYSFLPSAGFEGVMDEAKRLGIPVGGHVPLEVGMEILNSGIRSIEHLTEYTDGSMEESANQKAEADLRTVFHAGEIDRKRLDSLADRSVEAGIWNVPTLT